MTEHFSSSDFVGGIFAGMLISAVMLGICVAILAAKGQVVRTGHLRRLVRQDVQRCMVDAIEKFEFQGSMYHTHVKRMKSQIIELVQGVR